jgi:hypothetical protein
MNDLITGFIASVAAYAAWQYATARDPPAPPAPRLQTIPVPVASLPGVKPGVMRAMAASVDSHMLSLAEPVTRRGFEDSSVRDVLDRVVMRKLVGASPPQSIDPHVTVVESATCVANSAGSVQFDIVFTFHDAVSLVSVKAFARVIALDDGAYLIAEFRPATRPEDPAAPEGSDVVSPTSSEYSQPLGAKI